jgi:hypothetical protein
MSEPPSDDPMAFSDAEAAELAHQSANGSGRRTNNTDNDRAPIICTTPMRRRIADIPPRTWAYGNFLLFGEAAAIGAVDGGGKGAMAAVIALSMITGLPLLGERVWRKGRVVIITYADDEDEWSRRIAAACLHYKLDYETVIDDFRFMSRPGGRVSFAAPSVRGGPVLFPDSEEIIQHVKRVGGAALMITDPFNHCHELEDGNSNALVSMVAREHTRIARACMIPDLVLHHLRKGATGAADDLMGALMLRATFRSCRIVQRMTEDEAKRLDLPSDQAWRYSRISASKENYAPPPERTTWYRFESVALGNPSELYPDGDNVQVTTTWLPPSPFKDIQLNTLKAIFDEIRAGTSDEQFYSPDRRAKRWVGEVIVKHAGKSEEVAASMLRAWLDNQVLIKDLAKDPDRRSPVGRVLLNDAKVAEILRPLAGWEAAE